MICAFTVVACESFGAATPPGADPEVEDGGGGGSAPGPEAGAGDGGSNPAPACDRSKPFGAPKLVAGVASEFIEGGGSLSPDGAFLLYHSNRDTRSDKRALFIAERPSPGAPFEGATPIATDPNLTVNDPHLLPDGTLFFSVAEDQGALRIESATLTAERTLVHRAAVPALASTAETIQPYLTRTRIYFASKRGGGGNYHIYSAAKRTGGGFDDPVLVDELAGTGWDWRPVVTPDDLTIYFSRSPSGSMSELDVYVARRDGPNDKFGPAERVAELSAPDVVDNPTWVSPDECTIYFDSQRRQNASGDVWMAERLP